METVKSSIWKSTWLSSGAGVSGLSLIYLCVKRLQFQWAIQIHSGSGRTCNTRFPSHIKMMKTGLSHHGTRSQHQSSSGIQSVEVKFLAQCTLETIVIFDPSPLFCLNRDCGTVRNVTAVIEVGLALNVNGSKVKMSSTVTAGYASYKFNSRMDIDIF